MNKKANIYMLALIAAATLLSIHSLILGIREISPTELFPGFWMFLVALMAALWCDADRYSRNWPYEFGYFVFLFWPVVLPYYLVKTRKINGFFMFVGFLCLVIAPDIIWLICYEVC